jgi:hypothetical protein
MVEPALEFANDPVLAIDLCAEFQDRFMQFAEIVFKETVSRFQFHNSPVECLIGHAHKNDLAAWLLQADRRTGAAVSLVGFAFLR